MPTDESLRLETLKSNGMLFRVKLNALSFFLSLGYMGHSLYRFLFKKKWPSSTFNHRHQTPSDKPFIRSYINRIKQMTPQLIPSHKGPIDVSIIIPVYNQWHFTRDCLNSILETCNDPITYEIILADDGSTDKTVDAQIQYPGIRIIQSPQNVGFLRNCNHAAPHARGRYIVLLNNDTIVLPHWLSSLYDTLENDATAAIAGSKMLYATGKIQEAGAVLFRDGSDTHIGRGKHRHTPLFNIQRETDCISGCSIIIRKSFWEAVGGFDERYKDAYFEDYDLAMTARAHGMRVIYQPKSEVIHFEHQTYVAHAKKNHQTLSNQNKRLFLDKWAETLAIAHLPRLPWYAAMQHAERTPSLAARQRRQTKRFNILFYSPDVLYPNKHGNRTRMCGLVRQFKDMGHSVHVAFLNQMECTEENLQQARQALQTTIDIIPCKRFWVSLNYVPFDGWYENGIGESIRGLCDQYDIDVVLCSYVFQSKLLKFVPSHILKVLDTHDVMANRSEMMRLNQLPGGRFSCSEQEESAYVRRADVVIGITEEERHYFNRISGQQNAIAISHIEPPHFFKKHFKTLCHVGIVASRNPFNLAMVQQFLDAVHQRMRGLDQFPIVIHLVGDIKKAVNLRKYVRKMQVFKQPWVHMHGFVPDIASFYQEMDLIVSPMMCGTGINIKTVEALAYGMPLLTTRHGARGIDTNEPMHQQNDLPALVDALFTLIELERLAEVSRLLYEPFCEKNRVGLTALFNHPKLNSI